MGTREGQPPAEHPGESKFEEIERKGREELPRILLKLNRYATFQVPRAGSGVRGNKSRRAQHHAILRVRVYGVWEEI
jgi:hypothetical protein